MNPNLPPLNSLKTFDAAARLKSFKKAAKELHVTPTAVSHQIKSLEELLDTLLFERKPRAVTLTKEGQLLAETTFRIFQQLTHTINQILASKETLTISTTSSFAAMWLIPNLDKFYHLHPEVEVLVKTGEHIDDIKRDRRIDMAIRYGDYNSNQARASTLITESIGMYATPNYLSQISNFEDANLLETVWLNNSLPPLSWQSLIDQNATNLPKLPVRQFNQEHHVIQAALASQGIALVSSLLVKHALKQQWLVPYTHDAIDNDLKGLTYYLLIPTHKEHNKNVIAFTQWINAEIHQDALNS